MSQCPALSGLASAGLHVEMNICIEHPRPSAREAPHLQPHWSSNLCSASPSSFEPFFENSTVEFFSPHLCGEFSQHWKAGLPWQQASSTGSRRFQKGDCCSWRKGMESHLSRPISMQDQGFPWQHLSYSGQCSLSPTCWDGMKQASGNLPVHLYDWNWPQLQSWGDPGPAAPSTASPPCPPPLCFPPPWKQSFTECPQCGGGVRTWSSSKIYSQGFIYLFFWLLGIYPPEWEINIELVLWFCWLFETCG